jgi:chaperonin cofactor prefoldin
MATTYESIGVDEDGEVLIQTTNTESAVSRKEDQLVRLNSQLSSLRQQQRKTATEITALTEDIAEIEAIVEVLPIV